MTSLKLRKACRIDGIPNEFLRHLPRRPLVYLAQLLNHCIQVVQKLDDERDLLSGSQMHEACGQRDFTFQQQQQHVYGRGVPGYRNIIGRPQFPLPRGL
jgi:hypothetical protein